MTRSDSEGYDEAVRRSSYSFGDNGVMSIENWSSFVESGMLHPASISRVGWQLTAAGQKHFEEDICARSLWGCCCLVQ